MYICSVNKKQNNLNRAATYKRRKIMKHFVFKSSNGVDYVLVYSTSMKQAEKDMGSKCLAAFMNKEDAEAFVWNYNNKWN